MITVSADGRRAYVVNQTANTVSVLDPAGRQVLDEIARETDIDVLAMPKLEEYYVGLRLQP